MKIKRILSLILAICLCLPVLVAVIPQAEAAGYYTENNLSNIKCTILSNPERAGYVNWMMRYHILSPNDNYRVARNLDSGKSVIFFFDGCSDNVDDPVYGNFNKYHLSAYCAVVREVDGVPRIVFESENCSTIPDNPRNPALNGNVAVPTVLDGVYNIISTNHNGRYAALRIADYSGYAPVIRCNWITSYIGSSGGINIHTRRAFPDVPPGGFSATSYNSTGCFNVGLPVDGWREYNRFIEVVMGISNAIVTTPEADGIWNQCYGYADQGIVVVDHSQYKAQLEAIYGGDGTRTAKELVSIITAYTDGLNVSAPVYTVKYDANGGTGAPSSQKKHYDVPLKLCAANPIREEHTFMGWSTNKNALFADYAPGDSVTFKTNTTLYAVWKSFFQDISNSSWQFVAAKYAFDNNLMVGKGTDRYGRVIFAPNAPITREEFVQVLYNASGKPPIGNDKVFPDVEDNRWYKAAVLWSNANDIASGIGSGDFGIGLNITRQDLALMLYKYAKLKGYSLNSNIGQIDQYADGDKVSSYARTAMDWAVTNGVLSGKGVAGKPLSTFNLDPAGTATRAECAAMLKNFMQAFSGTQQGCSHTAMTKTAASSATCTENGNTDYWHCANCGKYFADGSAATEIILADTVLEASGHSYQFTSDTATCTAAGTKTETCSNCGNEKTSASPAKGHGETKVETKEATCSEKGYKKTICKTCGQTVSQETIPANGQCTYVTMDLPSAATKAVNAGILNYGMYANSSFTDYDTKICTGCNTIDIASTHFRYSQREAAQMMLQWVNDLRAEVYGTHAYDLVLDDNCQAVAEQRAVQLTTNYSHSGQRTSGENIANYLGLYAQFVAWKNSPLHYEIMINRKNTRFGYGYAACGDNGFNAAHGYGCQAFNP